MVTEGAQCTCLPVVRGYEHEELAQQQQSMRARSETLGDARRHSLTPALPIDADAFGEA